MPTATNLFRTFLALVALAILGSGGNDARANSLQCGDIITRSTTLTQDLVCGPNDTFALAIAGSRVELDLAGFAIRLPHPANTIGVYTYHGVQGVRVHDGAIVSTATGSSAHYGVTAFDSPGLVVERLRISGFRVAVQTGISDRARIVKSEFNTATGVLIGHFFAAGYCCVRNVEVAGNTLRGVSGGTLVALSAGTLDLRVIGNSGIDLADGVAQLNGWRSTHRSVIADNHLAAAQRSAGGTGLVAVGDDIAIVGNVLVGFETGIGIAGQRAQVLGNQVAGDLGFREGSGVRFLCKHPSLRPGTVMSDSVVRGNTLESNTIGIYFQACANRNDGQLNMHWNNAREVVDEGYGNLW